ncbi:MAG: fatty acid desaturase [Pyrinomonadaceae bacterium]
MQKDTTLETSAAPPIDWRSLVSKYQKPSWRHGLWQVGTTFVPYFLSMYLMYQSLFFSYWLTLALGIVAGSLLLRIFVIFHDCTHGSLFPSKRANNWLGMASGVLLFTPFYEWRRHHVIHHATSSNLDRRGWWEIKTITVAEYLQLSRWERLSYRIYRHPIVLLGFGPLVVFLVLQRFCSPGARERERQNVHWTNVAILLVAVAGVLIFGVKNYLVIQLLAVWWAATAGMWLFYVQHQFEDAYWARRGAWNYQGAALQGSSFYRLPKMLQWFSANIGFHHIHHLNPQVPNYRLERCHEENLILQDVPTLDLKSSWRSLFVKLWDEDQGKMVSFSSAHAPKQLEMTQR